MKQIEIKGFPKYHITTDGNVISYKKGEGRAMVKTKAGNYYSVTLQGVGFEKKIRIHRIVAEHFIPNPQNKRCVNHIDGNKLNNNVLNLEWVTYSENAKHSYIIGRKTSKGAKIGKNINYGRQIVKMDLNENEICVYKNLYDCQRQTGVNRSNIVSQINGKIKTSGGFKWKYR